jgi:hypothetical protein
LQFSDKLESELRGYSKHPLIDSVKLLKPIKETVQAQVNALEKVRSQRPDLLDKDPIRETLTKLLDKKIGSPFPMERLNEIYKEGEKRYEKSIPPGYLDAKKSGEHKFGDLVMWLQIIDKAASAKLPIIMITDDVKEDWWWKHEGKIVGPKPELIGEIQLKAGVPFYMYQPDRFLEEARPYLGREVAQVAIDEVREVRAQNEEETAIIDRMLVDRERMLDVMADERRTRSAMISELRERHEELMEDLHRAESLPDHEKVKVQEELIKQIETLERKCNNLEERQRESDEFAHHSIAEIEKLRDRLVGFPKSELVIRR